MSYSQRDEEHWILEALKDMQGVFLDIGAHNGLTFSNTRALVERGWKGVFVEPALIPFQTLINHYGNSQHALVHALVGTKSGIKYFWDSEDCIGTTQLENYERWKNTATFRAPFWIPQVTIRTLISTFDSLLGMDFVSIDTEGTSAEILLDFPFDLCRPTVICVEHDDQQNLLTPSLASQGYALHYDNAENMVFVKS